MRLLARGPVAMGWDRFWETAIALAVINRAELKERWQSVGKARAKR